MNTTINYKALPLGSKSWTDLRTVAAIASRKESPLLDGFAREGMSLKFCGTFISGMVDIIAMTQDEDGSYGHLIQFFDGAVGKTVTHVVPLKLFYGDDDELIQFLLDKNVTISPFCSSRRRLLRHLKKSSEIAQRWMNFARWGMR
jgi:hypothetical protein